MQNHSDDSVTLTKQEFDVLKKIEEAARIAFAHLSYLDNCGVLTRKEEPMMDALREALNP
jgi:hypothetical protein